MEQILYERPREKLRNRGVKALSLLELLQLIIGSGNARVSAARLAREVEGLITSRTATYAALIQIDGLGDAKACQILASLELAGRVP